MSFDEIFDLTAGVYFHFYNITVRIDLLCESNTPNVQNLRAHK